VWRYWQSVFGDVVGSKRCCSSVNQRAKFCILKNNFAKSIVYADIIKKYPRDNEATNNLAELLVTYQAGNKQSILFRIICKELPTGFPSKDEKEAVSQ